MSFSRTRIPFAAITAAAVSLVAGYSVATDVVHSQSDLEIGKVAPEIEGVDIDGVAFKLSDYRGKVVVLDFWGDW